MKPRHRIVPLCLVVVAAATLAGSLLASCAGRDTPTRPQPQPRVETAPDDPDPSAPAWTHCTRDDECVIVPTLYCWCGQLPVDQLRSIRRGLEEAHARRFLYSAGGPPSCPACVTLPFDPAAAASCRAGRCIVTSRADASAPAQ